MKNFTPKLLALTSYLLLAGISNPTISLERRNFKSLANDLISNAVKEEVKVKTVTASGFGVSLDEAAKNAAQNALTNVVGTFIDAKKMLRERVKIYDGILSESTIIKENINSYSQGSIKYFEILNIKQNDSIFYVTARVDVRIDDFRRYIKKLASDSKEIDSGLFTSIKTDKENLEKKIDFLDEIISPLVSGEVIKIKIDEPQRLDQLSAFDCEYSDFGSINCSGKNLSYWSSPTGSVVIPVTFELDQDFKKNSVNILENISNKKLTDSIQEKFIPKFKTYNEQNDYIITLINSSNNTLVRYLLSDSKSINQKRKTITGRKMIPVIPYEYCYADFPKIKLSLLDQNELSIWEKKFIQCDKYKELDFSDNKVKVKFIYLPPDEGGYITPIFSSLYNNLKFGPWPYAKSVIYDRSRLLLIIEPENDLLDKIQAVKLEYVQNSGL